MGFILLIITWFLTPIFEVCDYIITIWVRRKEYRFFKTTSNYFTISALERDRFANYNYRVGLNFIFSKGGYKFGNKKETLSSVLGKKQIEKSLTLLGWGLVYLLWIIDYASWFKGGHCYNSINDNL